MKSVLLSACVVLHIRLINKKKKILVHFPNCVPTYLIFEKFISTTRGNLSKPIAFCNSRPRGHSYSDSNTSTRYQTVTPLTQKRTFQVTFLHLTDKKHHKRYEHRKRQNTNMFRYSRQLKHTITKRTQKLRHH